MPAEPFQGLQRPLAFGSGLKAQAVVQDDRQAGKLSQQIRQLVLQAAPAQHVDRKALVAGGAPEGSHSWMVETVARCRNASQTPHGAFPRELPQ